MDNWKALYLQKIEYYRKKLKECPRYSGLKWQTKVDLMSPKQVEAIYRRFAEDGVFDEDYIPPPKQLKGQISMFDEEQIEMDLSSLF